MTGKQCIGSPIHQASNQMDARSMQIPGKINVAQSSRSRKLRGLANAYHTQRQ
jgi:hypothetical protein